MEALCMGRFASNVQTRGIIAGIVEDRLPVQYACNAIYANRPLHLTAHILTAPEPLH
jgi:hypothetical protein